MNLFGTDGIRGEANRYPVTPEVALKVGLAVGYLFRNQGYHRRIIVGKDTRLSGYMLEMALSAGILSMGAEAWLVGPMPTPAIAFLTRDLRAEAGVVISASHNPFYDNGIKIFGADGFKLSDELEARIEALLEDEVLEQEKALGKELGKARRIEDARGRYMVHLKKAFPERLDLEGLKVVVDCAHGATYRIAPELLEELGAKVIRMGCEPNGVNINDGCGALHPDGLRERVLSEGADLGLAFDGDGDRLVLVDEKGGVVDGDQIMALCALFLKEEGALRKNTVVATVMSNLGFEKFLSRHGIKLVRTQVGDRYVVEEMRRGGYCLGGEQSGHIVFLDHNTTGDGILTALKVLAILKIKERPASEVFRLFERMPQVLKNVKVKVKKPLDEIEGLSEKVRSIKEMLGDKGRILVRPSGTEPKYRVMVEGEDRGFIEELAEEVADFIKQRLC
ncbi:phosphoglucosamine mutase [Thermosulfurimonas dismutans]|uniref:Phosphoglucosamine mutase n=1 Tax=Thermosulfurimonas dismutans TaxID=999894 RepID=A0A179D5X8_9BACT|nr:phosphoglucosamine mutase [Thermosulfurimonas dismutans]OAQ21191.1 Phosphoglucosamine mutase [Thermosulfurimonas dismutans]